MCFCFCRVSWTRRDGGSQEMCLRYDVLFANERMHFDHSGAVQKNPKWSVCHGLPAPRKSHRNPGQMGVASVLGARVRGFCPRVMYLHITDLVAESQFICLHWRQRVYIQSWLGSIKNQLLRVLHIHGWRKVSMTHSMSSRTLCVLWNLESTEQMSWI